MMPDPKALAHDRSEPDAFTLASEAVFISRTGVGFDGKPLDEQTEVMWLAVICATSSGEARSAASIMQPRLT